MGRPRKEEADKKLLSIHTEIMRKCYDSNHKLYPKYGGRGITVCDEWHIADNFKKWALANGYNGEMRFSRIDTNRGYSPDNCKVALFRKYDFDCELQRKRRKADWNYEKKRRMGVKTLEEHPLYATYKGIKNRCYRKSNPMYKYYGGKGIKVCDEWLGDDGFYNFVEWSNTNGYKKELSIDRINPNLGYSPNNCRWADTITPWRKKPR